MTEMIFHDLLKMGAFYSDRRVFLNHDHHKEYKWDWPYYIKVVYMPFEDSDIFRSKHNFPKSFPKEYKNIYIHIAKIKGTYREDFDELEDAVVEYGGISFSENIMI